MSTLRIARIPYLNSAPFYQCLDGAGYELVDMAPRALGKLARDGRVDAGILSLCDLRRTDDFEDLGDLGISLDGPAHSVMLFSRGSLDVLGGATIAVTGESSTSFPLLRLLLEERHGIRPAAYVRRPEGAAEDDAATLLIGDAALRLAAEGGLVPGLGDYAAPMIALARPVAGGWTHATDLGAAWDEWQGLPFVFARWGIRRDVPQELRSGLEARLRESLRHASQDLLELAAGYCAPAGLDAEAGRAYLERFGYDFGPRELAGEAAFLKLLRAAEWWEDDLAMAPMEVMS